MKAQVTNEEKEEQARLCEEIEKLYNEADEILGEVVRMRKNYPKIIAELRNLENRERFARWAQAPLLSVSSDPIDVEKLKKEITLKVDKTKTVSEERKELEKEIEELEAELEKWDRYNNSLLDMLTSEKYAPIDALPPDFKLS
ncbi:hypothetical protein RB195_013301 [Necator americanus]|uniref:Uncharacterized protein n=1 Tax=Necator americanus TaxID=51031 RepID=A0ABR1DUV6_NECAM